MVADASTLGADEGSAHPYIPNTPADRAIMLERLGLHSSDELFAALPAAYRDPQIDLLPELSEPELLHLMRARAAENRDRPQQDADIVRIDAEEEAVEQP